MAPKFENGASSRRVGWEIETNVAWKEYTASVEGLLVGYERGSERGASVSFVKRISGDAFSVVIDRTSDGPPLKVRVAFVALAD